MDERKEISTILVGVVMIILNMSILIFIEATTEKNSYLYLICLISNLFLIVIVVYWILMYFKEISKEEKEPGIYYEGDF